MYWINLCLGFLNADLSYKREIGLTRLTGIFDHRFLGQEEIPVTKPMSSASMDASNNPSFQSVGTNLFDMPKASALNCNTYLQK